MERLQHFRKQAPLVAALMLAVIGGLHASAATVVAAGTSDSPAVAQLAAHVSTPGLDEMATPAAYAVGFLVGYIVADLLDDWGRRAVPDALPVISETAFDF